MKRVVIVSLLGAAAVAALVVLLVRGRGSAANPGARAELGDGGVTVFDLQSWLDSCVKPCRRSVQLKMGHLSPEKQRQFCDVNCECGLEKMTEPGPKPGQVQAPSAAWLRLDDQQQMAAAKECQKRSNDAVAAAQPPGAP